MIIDKLQKMNLIHPPKWLADNTCYLTVMGSDAYGVSSGSSDLDVYGFCLPPVENIFSHLGGEIPGFGKQIKRFDQWQEHHVKHDEKEYDFVVYNIVKYFQLCMENNPNMIDSLFTPQRCIIHSTALGEHVRANRKMFLHKGSWHKFKGYAYAQLHKIKNKVNSSNPKRAETIEKFGFDIKFAYHLVRLLNEVEQILVEHDLDLERNREQLKAIRRGEWTLEKIENYFYDKERSLEATYSSSTLQHSPNEDKIKNLLLECLEMHYGNLNVLSTIRKEMASVSTVLNEIQVIIDKYKGIS